MADWTTSEQAVTVERDVTHSTEHQGLKVTVTRMSYGSVTASVLGWIAGRRVTVLDFSPDRKTSDEGLRAGALALANDLLAAGFTGQPEPVSAVAGLTPDEGDHAFFPAAAA